MRERKLLRRRGAYRKQLRRGRRNREQRRAMSDFAYRGDMLHAEDVSLAAIAEEFGTPVYVYSSAALERNFRAYADALRGIDHLVCYAVKANGNLAVLQRLARLGAGFDIVSGGELERVLRAGGEAGRVVFSGVAKSRAEIERALAAGIRCFNAESLQELERLSAAAVDAGRGAGKTVCTAVDAEGVAGRAAGAAGRMAGKAGGAAGEAGGAAGEAGRGAAVSLRINPDVDAGTHPYIATGLRGSKFGIPAGEAMAACKLAAELPGLELAGIGCHIGSQLTRLEPFIAALKSLLALVDELAAEGIRLRHLDLGGGLGVRYRDEQPPAIGEYIAALRAELDGRDLELIVEPGRSIAANAGVLLTRVDSIKDGGACRFAICDAAMNDLLRPALYGAWLDILPVRRDGGAASGVYNVVGPVCEAGDFLGLERELAIAPGDLLCVMDAGAYGFAMSSNYNSRPRPAEVMVEGGKAHLVRARETFEDMIRGERLLPSS